LRLPYLLGTPATMSGQALEGWSSTRQQRGRLPDVVICCRENDITEKGQIKIIVKFRK